MFTPAIDNWFFERVIEIAAIAIGIAMIFATVRLIRGPRLADRVIALDLIGALAIGVIALYSIAVGRPEMLSVAIVMALILFLGTAAFAGYLERRARP
ncbi:MAG: monovalent cation/H+ antiporter complex subunit F [Planctomycetota bacterium]